MNAQRRPLDSGRRDSLGRIIRVGDDTSTSRSDAPPPQGRHAYNLDADHQLVHPYEYRRYTLSKQAAKDAETAFTSRSTTDYRRAGSDPNLGTTRKGRRLLNRAVYGDSLAAESVACNPNLTDQQLEHLLNHPHPRVQTAVARNPRLTETQAVRILNSGNEIAADVIAHHPVWTREQLYARAMGSHAGMSDRARAALATNPRLTVDDLAAIDARHPGNTTIHAGVIANPRVAELSTWLKAGWSIPAAHHMYETRGPSADIPDADSPAGAALAADEHLADHVASRASWQQLFAARPAVPIYHVI